jgi:DNA-directed RNA polymerase specialized sigma24 family protein
MPLMSRAIECAREGDRDALRYLYARYADNVCADVLAVVRDRHVAEDVTRETFTTLSDAIAGYEESDGPLDAWIGGLAHDAARERTRRDTTLVDRSHTRGTPGDPPAHPAHHLPVRLQPGCA